MLGADCGGGCRLYNLSSVCSSGEHLQFPGQTVLGGLLLCIKRSREWGSGWKTPRLPFQSVTSATVWDTADLVNLFCLSISSQSETKGRSCEQHETPYPPPRGWNIQLSGENCLKASLCEDCRVSLLVLMFEKWNELPTCSTREVKMLPFSCKRLNTVHLKNKLSFFNVFLFTPFF